MLEACWREGWADPSVAGSPTLESIYTEGEGENPFGVGVPLGPEGSTGEKPSAVGHPLGQAKATNEHG